MHKHLYIFLLTLFFYAHSGSLYAQESNTRIWETNATVHFGYLIPHSPEVKEMGTSLPRGIQLDAMYQTNGLKEWEQAYNYPLVGYNINYFDMGMPNILGQAISVGTYLEPYLYRGKNVRATYRIGTGLVYATQMYHEEQNPVNIAISTPFSFVMQGSFNTYYNVTDQLYLKTSAGLTHYSNGAIRMPNAGLNIISASVGAGYRFDARPAQFIKREAEPVARKLNVEFVLSGAVNEHLPVGRGRHFAWTNAIYLTQRLSRKSGLFIGGELFRNKALKAQLPDWPGMEDADYRRVGVSIGHELYISRLSMVTQAGYYVYQPVPFNINYYQRVVLKYYVSNNLFATWGLKTHLARAEFLDLGVGVRL
jgi:hypothetical protein